MSKRPALLLIAILAVSSLIMVESAFAQSAPKPSVPEFTLELVGPPFYVNTTYSLDPSTGQIVAKIGYTNEYSYVMLVIKNQPFNPSYGSLYYNVQIRNQNTPYENWTVVRYDGPNPLQTTDSEYTNISLRIDGQWGLPSIAGTQTDVQVQAMLGNFYYGHSNPPITSGFMFSGITSDWSSTQTLRIPANIPLSATLTPSTSPAATPSPTNYIGVHLTEQEVIIIVTIAAALIGAGLGLLFYFKKRRREAEPS
jgi:hypothetical protein